MTEAKWLQRLNIYNLPLMSRWLTMVWKWCPFHHHHSAEEVTVLPALALIHASCPSPPAMAQVLERLLGSPTKLGNHVPLDRQAPAASHGCLLSPSEHQQAHRQEVPWAPAHQD